VFELEDRLKYGNVPQREQSEKPKPRCVDEAWDTRKGFDAFGNERVSGHVSGIGVVSEPARNRGGAAGNVGAFMVRPRKPPFSKGGSSLPEIGLKRSTPNCPAPYDNSTTSNEVAPGKGFEPLRPKGPHALKACALPGLATPAPNNPLSKAIITFR
jgi:hypothetical protein